MPKHSPGIDYLSGAFFLGWAAVGWFAYLGNERLRASLFASADPGPALLPLIALSLLSVGGATALATGVVRSRREAPHAAWERPPPWRDHLAPVAFGASVVLLVFLMSRIGFPAAAFSLCAIWLYALSAGRRVAPRDALVAVVAAAAMVAAVYGVFAHLLMVPLPR